MCIHPRKHWQPLGQTLALTVTMVLAASPTPAAEVVFRDDFDSPELEQGWVIVNEDAARYTLTAREGFFRINTQRGTVGESVTVRNLLLREMSGAFILDTRVEFNPRAAQEFAGVAVYLDDAHAVALGLAFASGERGRFRGIVMLSVGEDSDGDGRRPGAFYDEANAENPNAVYLRLLRSGDKFVGAFSPNGQTYTDIGTITNEMPNTVMVGLGAANGDYSGCGSECDLSIPADFDFVQISKLADGEPIIDVTLEAVTVEGPDEVVAGSTVSFTAIASFSDGSTQDVTDQAEWIVAPSEVAQIEVGEFSAGAVDSTRQVTVVASYTQFTVNGEVSQSGSKLVRVAVDSSSGGGGPPARRLCGTGLVAIAPFILMPLLWRRLVSRVFITSHRMVEHSSLNLHVTGRPGCGTDVSASAGHGGYRKRVSTVARLSGTRAVCRKPARARPCPPLLMGLDMNSRADTI